MQYLFFMNVPAAYSIVLQYGIFEKNLNILKIHKKHNILLETC